MVFGINIQPPTGFGRVVCLVPAPVISAPDQHHRAMRHRNAVIYSTPLAPSSLRALPSFARARSACTGSKTGLRMCWGTVMLPGGRSAEGTLIAM